MRNTTIKHCDFRIHDIIDGKFRVERVLSSTQTDQEFKVNDASGKEYILKLLKLWEVEPHLRHNMQLAADNEIKSCQIKSNYLTGIVHAGVVNGNPYILTEYNRTLDLTHYFKNKNLNLVKVVKEILYGLNDLHKSGKVHSRLTPENIFIIDGERAMITNYATLDARNSAEANRNKWLRSRFIDKSLAYQAPELYRQERFSAILPAVDIFSFGVILFQMLTGELPFGRLTTDTDWIHYQTRIRTNDWNKSILLRNDNQEMWMSILDVCLQADASMRARNVNEIIELLPKDKYLYSSAKDSLVEAPKNILNGVMLRIMQGEELGATYRLPEIMQMPKRIITLGREDKSVFNMIQLRESLTSYISRRHCTIELDPDENIWYIRDGQWDKEAKEQWTSSLNGTYVNSDKVSEDGYRIVPGDIISIGDIKIRVEAY